MKLLMWLLLPISAMAGDKKIWDCLKVTQLNPVGDNAYEIKAQNDCAQDFEYANISLIFLNKDGFKITQCIVTISNVGGKEKWHEVQPAPAPRAFTIKVKEIKGPPEKKEKK